MRNQSNVLVVNKIILSVVNVSELSFVGRMT